MAEPNDDPLMREIEEELRQEQARKLWDRYGKFVIGVAVVVVAIVAGYQGWQSYDRSKKLTATDRLIGAAALVDGDREAALESLGRVEQDSPAGVAVIAKLRRASLLAASGDHAAASQIYGEIISDANTPATFGDLARILRAVQDLDADESTAQRIVDELKGLTASSSVWRHSAREVSAIALITLGQRDEAREQLQAIALDPQAPGGVRSRAEELLQALGQ